MKKVVVLLLVLCPIILMGYTELNGDLSGQTLTAGTYLIGQCSVAEGTTLQIQAGAILKFNSGQMSLNIAGTLLVNGTSTNFVYFTSKNDDSIGEIITDSNGNPQPGDWENVSIYQGVGEFDYAVIRYGGNSSNSGRSNLNFRNSATGWFRNSSSEYASHHGIRIYENSDVEISNSEFNSNGNNGMYGLESTLQITDCSFNNNTNSGVYISGTIDFTQFSNLSFTQNGGNGINISGNISSNMVWPLNSEYSVIVSYITIDTGVVCTIPAGTIHPTTKRLKISIITYK